MESESGAYFLHVDSFVAFGENVSMVPEENEVSLVVEGDDSSAFELRVLGEEGGEEPADLDTDFGVKVVENEFGDVLTGDSMVFNLFLELDISDLEHPKHAFKMAYQQFIPPVIVPDNHNMSIIKIFGTGIHLIKFHIFPGVVVNVMKDHHQFFEVIINFFGWLYGSGQ